MKLPIFEPYIISYKHHALKLAILGDYKIVSSWISSNFIQLYTPYNIFTDSDCDPHWLDFFLVKDCDESWLTIEPINTLSLKNNCNLEKYIEDIIISGSYLYTYYDSFYLSHTPNYGIRHFPMNFLIYGFSREHKIFYVYDYDYVISKKIKNIEVPYKDLVDAIIKIEISHNDWAEKSQIFTLKNNVSYSLDLGLIKNLLTDYLTCVKTYKRYGEQSQYEHSLYGMDIYSALFHQIQLIKEKKSKNIILPFSIFWEHKKNIFSLIKEIANEHKLQGYNIIKQYSVIEQNAISLRNMMIKFALTEDLEILNIATTKLKSIEEAERRSLENMLESIHNER